MPKRAKILVVEDEIVVARDLEMRLTHLGFEATIAGNADEAVAKATSFIPDLILMDVRLVPGGPDGIEAARKITELFDVPVVYVTAFTDDKTLFRARQTNPAGYVVKPVQTRELQITMELALYRHAAEKQLRASRRWLSAVLRSIGDAVIAADDKACLEFMNPAAEALTGWTEEEARGRPMRAIFNIRLVNDASNPWQSRNEQEFLQLGFLGRAVLTTKTGEEREIELVVSQIVEDHRVDAGEVVVFQDTSVRDLHAARKVG